MKHWNRHEHRTRRQQQLYLLVSDTHSIKNVDAAETTHKNNTAKKKKWKQAYRIPCLCRRREREQPAAFWWLRLGNEIEKNDFGKERSNSYLKYYYYLKRSNSLILNALNIIFFIKDYYLKRLKSVWGAFVSNFQC